MKWSVIGLVLLGGIAATSASVLVASLRKGPPAGEPELVAEPELEEPELEEPVIDPEVEILVASRDLSATAVVEAGQVERRTVPSSVAPEGAFADPVQVVGKLLITPMTAGQAFSQALFASEGSGLHLSTALARGKRAVNVTLSDMMGMEGLLYPGSVVDVLASMKIELEDSVGQHTVSMTILQNVFVLAVGGQTVLGEGGEERRPDDGRPAAGRERRPTVTLLVDSEEAEILKLAMDEGNVSLAMRNPMDNEWTDSRGTRAGALSPLIALLEESKRNNILEKEKYEMERSRIANERERAQIEIDREKFEREKLEARRAKEEKTAPPWETLVLRSGVAEIKTFERED